MLSPTPDTKQLIYLFICADALSPESYAGLGYVRHSMILMEEGKSQVTHTCISYVLLPVLSKRTREKDIVNRPNNLLILSYSL